MYLNEVIKEKNLSKYWLSKKCDIPYTTLSDICNGKTQLNKCSSEIVYKLSKELNMSMEALIEPYMYHRSSFDLFRSNVCHRLKELGDIDFLIELLESDDIQTYYKRNWMLETFYLLAMLDYISKANNIPLSEEYNYLRNKKLASPVFPAGIVAKASATKDNSVFEKAISTAIPEFLKYNIVESEIRNVI